MHNEGTEKRFARPPVFAKQSYICYKFTNKLLNLKILPNLCHRSEFTDRTGPAKWFPRRGGPDC